MTQRADRLLQTIEKAQTKKHKIFKGDAKCFPELSRFCGVHGFSVGPETVDEFAAIAQTCKETADAEVHAALACEDFRDIKRKEKIEDTMDQDGADAPSVALAAYVEKWGFKFSSKTFQDFGDVLRTCRLLVVDSELRGYCDPEDEACTGPPGPKLKAYVEKHGKNLSLDTMDEFAPIVWAFRRKAEAEYQEAMEWEDGAAAEGGGGGGAGDVEEEEEYDDDDDDDDDDEY